MISVWKHHMLTLLMIWVEGSGIEILLNEKDALKKCSQLIIELHQTSYQDIDYRVNELARIIEDRHRFNLIEHQGSAYYFERSITPME